MVEGMEGMELLLEVCFFEEGLTFLLSIFHF